jgi:hypothetical protein
MSNAISSYKPMAPAGTWRSTCQLKICGDVRQPFWNQWRYRALHRRRHLAENREPFAREIAWPPRVHDLGRLFASVDQPASPSRLLCDLFWMDLDWALIEQLLGEIRVHDMGCGSGRYAERLRRFSGRDLLYVGYDVEARREWSGAASPATSFHVFDGRDFTSVFASRPTLLVSQSALEHIPEELRYFDAAARYAAETGRPHLHIHLLPGASLLRQYGLHGYRQFTRDNVRTIAAACAPSARVSLFCLGDSRYADLHVGAYGNRRLRARLQRDSGERERYEAAGRALLDAPQPAGADTAAFLGLVIEVGLPDGVAGRLTRSQQMSAAADQGAAVSR